MSVNRVSIILVPVERQHGRAPVLAYVSCVVADLIRISSIRLIRLPSGRIHVAMPERERSPKVFVEVAHPVDQAARDVVDRAILAAYESSIRGSHAKMAKEVAGR